VHPIDQAAPLVAYALIVAGALTGGVDLIRWLRSADERAINDYARFRRALRRTVAR
jgi:hypothetical protein